MNRDIDLVVAVHSPDRQITRAVGSALRGSDERAIRVTVVCHNTPAAAIASRLGELAHDARVRLIELEDGIPSPAGPFNAGLAIADARFVAIMGSDDELHDGALASWLRTAEQGAADVVIPRLKYAAGAYVPTPPARPFRTHSLNGVRDRLSYRSAPLGLISRERFGQLRMTPRLSTGEDIAFSAQLWFSGARMSLGSRDAAYVIHNDARDRVTLLERPLREELAYLPLLFAEPWALALDPRARCALAVKLWRINVFGAAYYRSRRPWTSPDRIGLAEAGALIEAFSPDASAMLSLAELRLVRAVLDPSIAGTVLNEANHARRRFGYPDTLFTRKPAQWLARQAPLRMMAASAFARL